MPVGQGPGLAQLLAPGLAVGTAIALMHLTRTLPPPGGAAVVNDLLATRRYPET